MLCIFADLVITGPPSLDLANFAVVVVCCCTVTSLPPENTLISEIACEWGALV